MKCICMTNISPKRIFVDTSGWVEFALKKELHHKEVFDYMAAETKKGSKFFTSDYVLDETYTRLATNQGFWMAELFRKKLLFSEAKRDVLILFMDETLFERAWKVFDKYQEHGLSFTDATIATLVRDLKINEILALDQGFNKVGLVVKPG